MDKMNGNTLWEDAIKTELDSLMVMNTLAFLQNKAEQEQMQTDIKEHDFQYAKTWFMFTVKNGGK